MKTAGTLKSQHYFGLRTAIEKSSMKWLDFIILQNQNFLLFSKLKKKQVGPVLDPGKTHYSNYPACAEAPRIVFDQAYDYDWSIDSDPTCKIIREKNSR